MDPATAIAAGITGLGSIGSAALQRRWAIKDWEKVNAYNHPREQVKRLREANLPLATMFTGSGGSTSSDVRATEVDATLGTAHALDKYMALRMQKKQLSLIDQQIRKTGAEASYAEELANEKAGEVQWKMRSQIDPVTGFLIEGNKQVEGLESSLRIQKAQAQTQEVLAELQRAKSQADIDHTLQTIGLGKQQYEYNAIKQKVDKWILNRLDNKGISALEALIYKFLLQAR